MNAQLVAQQQRYIQAHQVQQQQQHQFQVQHPQQRPPHGYVAPHGHPAQHMQHSQHPQHPQHPPHLQHPQQPQHPQHPHHPHHPHHPQHPQHPQHPHNPQHPQQRRPMAPAPPRPRTAQQQNLDPAAHLTDLQARHERSLAAAKRPTDHAIPEAVEEFTIGDGVLQYNRMRDLERRLDAMMMRKIMSIEQEVEMEEEGGTTNPLATATRRQYRTMRIWISNTAENQPWQGTSDPDENTFDFQPVAEPRFKVKIVGKIIDDDPSEDRTDVGRQDDLYGGRNPLLDGLDSDVETDAGESDAFKGTSDAPLKPESRDKDTAKSQPHDTESKALRNKPEVQISKILEMLGKRSPPLKLSDCFEKITVDFDRSQTVQTEAPNPVEWKRPVKRSSENPPAGSDFDALEFERKRDENLHCTINLHRQSHGLYQLSEPLADLLQIKEATKSEVVQAIWQYIRLSRLPQEEEKGLAQSDEALRKVFGVDVIHLKGRLQEHLSHHLSILPPHRLPYTIRVDADFQADPAPTIYDIPIPIPPGQTTSPTLARIAFAALVHSPVAQLTAGAIAQRDAAQAQAVAALQDARARRAFAASLSSDPARFICQWLSSQRKDLEVILGDARFGNPDAEVADWERWQADEFRRGGTTGVWGSEGVRESVELMVRQQRA